MIKTLLLDTFLLMGIIWMLISIVYFCIRLDRLLSSMEKPVVETMEETAEVSIIRRRYFFPFRTFGLQ